MFEKFKQLGIAASFVVLPMQVEAATSDDVETAMLWLRSGVKAELLSDFDTEVRRQDTFEENRQSFEAEVDELFATYSGITRVNVLLALNENSEELDEIWKDYYLAGHNLLHPVLFGGSIENWNGIEGDKPFLRNKYRSGRTFLKGEWVDKCDVESHSFYLKMRMSEAPPSDDFWEEEWEALSDIMEKDKYLDEFNRRSTRDWVSRRIDQWAEARDFEQFSLEENRRFQDIALEYNNNGMRPDLLFEKSTEAYMNERIQEGELDARAYLLMNESSLHSKRAEFIRSIDLEKLNVPIPGLYEYHQKKDIFLKSARSKAEKSSITFERFKKLYSSSLEFEVSYTAWNKRFFEEEFPVVYDVLPFALGESPDTVEALVSAFLEHPEYPFFTAFKLQDVGGSAYWREYLISNDIHSYEVYRQVSLHEFLHVNAQARKVSNFHVNLSEGINESLNQRVMELSGVWEHPFVAYSGIVSFVGELDSDYAVAAFYTNSEVPAVEFNDFPMIIDGVNLDTEQERFLCRSILDQIGLENADLAEVNSFLKDLFNTVFWESSDGNDHYAKLSERLRVLSH